MNQFIPLDQARQMTALYRAQKEGILSSVFRGHDLLSICETFDAQALLSVLNTPGCASLRIYFGMNDDFKVHAILVGVNENDEDMLPQTLSNSLRASSNGTTTGIIENGIVCPPTCPPSSPLNS